MHLWESLMHFCLRPRPQLAPRGQRCRLTAGTRRPYGHRCQARTPRAKVSVRLLAAPGSYLPRVQEAPKSESKARRFARQEEGLRECSLRHAAPGPSLAVIAAGPRRRCLSSAAGPAPLGWQSIEKLALQPQRPRSASASSRRSRRRCASARPGCPACRSVPCCGTARASPRQAPQSPGRCLRRAGLASAARSSPPAVPQ
mmetsp:Transcript_46209/g.147556  ORF Transcript_46209/g.147556 Transcript_46209/m.147556 type:complete len:200 (+) Transcript_46209:81-680(+)